MLRRCRNKPRTGDGVPTEIEKDDLSDVIILDSPECFLKKIKQPITQSKSARCLLKNVILIEDDDGDGKEDIHSESSRERYFSPYMSDENSDDCLFVQERKAPVKLSKNRRTYSRRAVNGNIYGFSVSDSETSSDSDCELIIESFGKCPKEWVKSSSKRINRDQNTESQPEHEQTGENHCIPSMGAAGEEKEDVLLGAGGNDSSGASSSGFPNCAEDMDIDFQYNLKDPFSEPCISKPMSGVKFSCLMQDSSLGKGDCLHEDLCSYGDENGNEHCSFTVCGSNFATNSNSKLTKKSTHRSSGIEEKNMSMNYKSHSEDTNGNMYSVNNCSTGLVDNFSKNVSYDEEKEEAIHDNNCSTLITEKERLKETDEYKKALEEELASRRRALQIQAEEAQQMRRLVKRRKAERMRLLDMERRQKQRLEEMRETQKKDEENMNTKDVIRSEVRRELSKLEKTCCDMASVLRGLGITVGGSPSPKLNEVRAAYKRALLTFHPDRASRGDIRQQVEAEEKFKLISRMKEKYMHST
ncbi:unnamed protein product [Cuscuta campestris]|uniref:J domain-containing protein n=1 Tax=Cuscuta campestris TaxID=132261 RepID=A0A484L3U9_9ASTE|nr:unnamed protein product [Cuscuta campestris]